MSKASYILSGIKDACFAAGAVAVPIIVLLVGNDFNESIKDKEVKLKTVEMAVAILQQQPDKNNKESLIVRGWAIDVLDKYSGVRINPEQRAALEATSLPELSVSECLNATNDFINSKIPPNAADDNYNQVKIALKEYLRSIGCRYVKLNFKSGLIQNSIPLD